MLRLHSFSVDQTSTYKLWISEMQSKHTHMYFPWSQENAPRAPKTKEVSWRSQLAHFADMCAHWTPTQNAFWQEVRSERDDLTSCRVSATLGGRSCPWHKFWMIPTCWETHICSLLLCYSGSSLPKRLGEISFHHQKPTWVGTWGPKIFHPKLDLLEE